MPKARSKDPLLAATTSILLPAVKPFGFQRRTARSLDRICDDVLHSISPWYSGWGGRDFYVPYSVMPLVPPTDFEYVARGTRLWDPIGKSYSWPGQTHELADDSMQRAVLLLQAEVLPNFFARVETTESFLTYLQQEPKADHHEHFRRACCLVKLQRLDEAMLELNAAIIGYVADGRDWCFPKIAQCEEMRKAISAGTSRQLYDEWKTQTIKNLRLEKIIPHKSTAEG
jgi:hypothetical protein